MAPEVIRDVAVFLFLKFCMKTNGLPSTRKSLVFWLTRRMRKNIGGLFSFMY